MDDAYSILIYIKKTVAFYFFFPYGHHLTVPAILAFLFFPRLLFFLDEQQALQQFPEGHSAGEQAAERLQSQR